MATHPPKAGFPATKPLYPTTAPKKKPVAPKKPPTTQPASSTGPPALTVQQQAQQEAEAYIAMLQQQIQLEQDAYEREIQRQAQLERDRANALAQAISSLNLPGAIQNIFGSAAESQAGLAGGFSSELQASANQQAAEMNNMLAGSGQEARNQGVNMGDVIYGTEGFIPAQTFGAEGAGFAAQAALQPTFAQAQGLQNAARILAESQPNIQQYITQKAQARSQYPTAYQEALSRIQDRTAALKNEAMQLYQAGLITQRELGRRLGLPNWKKLPNTTYGSSTSAAAPTTRSIGGYLYQYDPKTGRWIPVAGQGNAPKTITQGGYIWQQDPKTGKWVRVGGSGPSATSGGGGYQLKTLPDKSLAVFDPKTGALVVISGPPKGANKPKASAAQKKRAGQIAKGSAIGVPTTQYDKDGNPVHGTNYQSYQEALNQMLAEGIPRAAALNALNRYWYKGAKGTKIGYFNILGNTKMYEPGWIPFLYHPGWENVYEGRPLMTYKQAMAAWKKGQSGGSKKAPSSNSSYSVPKTSAGGAAAGRIAVGAGGQTGAVVAAAQSQLGKPYVFGSGPSTSSFDCSELIQWAYGQIGIKLPRDTYGQIKVGRKVTGGSLQPGDLIFSSTSHVVLYIGNGWVIAAPHTGEVVQYQPLSNFRIYQVRRILPNQRIEV